MLGRRISVDNTGTPGVANVLLNYSYDPQGNLISVKDTINGQEKATTAYIYDELNRVKQISQSGNGVANKRVDFDYNSIGQYESVKRYADLNGSLNVVDSDYVYDLKDRLDNLTHKQNSATLAFYDFDYDKADRINQIVDIDGTSYYTHDKTNQLTEAVHTDNSKPDEYYNYDANGNRINSYRHSSYGTGENNRLLSDGVYNYEYDDEGNLIRRTEIVSNNVTDYSWDYRNRLVGVTDKNSGGNTLQTVTFAYDGMNRRIKKAVNGSVTSFVYDNENVLLEFGSGGLEQRYLHGTGIDQVLAQENSTSNVVWYLTDHLGTVRDLVNNNGGVLNHLSYDSFGNVVSQSSSSFKSRYGFTGRELDSEIGLYFYRGRYYDGKVGRFLSEDPIGFNGGDSNLYRYVKNSPIDRIDPLGTRDMRWPLNASVTNNSSRPVIILNSNRTGDYLETLQPGQGTPDSIGQSKDADGVWVCRNNSWEFYEVTLGNLSLQNISVQLPFGGSVSLPVMVPKDITMGDVIVTDNQVRDRGGRILVPGSPQNRGRQSSNTPPGGSHDCSCLSKIVQQYPDASVWQPVLPGDEEIDGNTLERLIYSAGDQADLIKQQVMRDLENLGYPIWK